MLLKKTLILTSLVVVLSALLALWLFDKLMVASGRDSGHKFFVLPNTPLGTPQSKLQLHSMRRSA